MVNKRENERIAKVLSEAMKANVRLLKEQSEKTSIQWLHNPVAVSMVPTKHVEPEDRKSVLEPSIDMRAYHPTWFMKKKSVRH